MTNYRRHTLAGGTYFFTQVTYQRHPWLCSDIARITLRAAITAGAAANHLLVIPVCVCAAPRPCLSDRQLDCSS